MDYLKELSTSDIELLINDYKLQKSGYIINYIIDSYDVFEYAFPYGKDFKKFSIANIDNIGDNFIAYEHIFSNYHPIILDEYKYELINNRNIIHSLVDKRLKKDLLEITDEIADRESIIDNMSKSATFMLAIAFMEKPMIDFFDDIYNKNLQIDSLSINNKIDKQIIYKAFKDNRRSNWSSKIFLDWVKKDTSTFDDLNKLKQLYKSTLIDFIVIDRVCRINSELDKDPLLNEKYLFLYLSGAKKSNQIFHLEKVLSHLPNIDNYNKYNVLRTPKHAYLLSLLHSNDINLILQKLEILKNISKKVEISHEVLGNLTTNNKLSIKEKKLLEEISKRRREKLEFGFVNNKIKEDITIREKIERIIKKFKKANDNDYLEMYKNFYNKAINSNESFTLLQYNTSILIEENILNLIKTLSSKKDFFVPSGMDLIRGTYHQFPILLFLNNKLFFSDDNMNTLFFEIVSFITKPISIRMENSKKFTERIFDIYSRIEKTYIEDFSDVLLKVFILCIIQDKKQHGTDDKIRILDMLEDTYTYLSISDYKQLDEDYLYSLVWFSRRLNKTEKNIKYIEIGLQKYPDDPRFYHGKVLYLYNLCLKEHLKSCSSDSIVEIISLVEKTIELYNKSFHNEHINANYSVLIQGNVYSLHNLLLYIISVYYLHNLEDGTDIDSVQINKYSLSYLRTKVLKTAKQFEFTSINKLKQYPEFCHTEALFELVEGISNKDIKKIMRAKEEVKCALNLVPTSELYKKTDNKIDKWYGIIK